MKISAIAVIYAELILEGEKTLDEVPAKIRPQVEYLLKEWGVL